MKKEKFSVGDKVFLVHLQQQGVVKRMVGAELLYVEVDGDDIPVFVSDVSKEVPLTQEEKARAEEATEIKRRAEDHSIQKTSLGIFISFSPVKTSGGEILSFDVYLINDTEFPIDFVYYFFLDEEIHFVLKKLLTPHNYMLLHSIDHDLLNEMPSVQFEVRDVSKNFSGKLNQKIKPQNFFNKLQQSPLMDNESYCYKVNTQALKKKEEVKPVEKVSFDAEMLEMMMQDTIVKKDVDVGAADEEIDLHIEALTKDFPFMSNSEMIQLQLGRFQQSLERAIAHGAGRFYVIHGVGSGKLKQEIHRLLKQYKEVKSYNNNYHPRYGFGATEVFLH